MKTFTKGDVIDYIKPYVIREIILDESWDDEDEYSDNISVTFRIAR